MSIREYPTLRKSQRTQNHTCIVPEYFVSPGTTRNIFTKTCLCTLWFNLKIQLTVFVVLSIQHGRNVNVLNTTLVQWIRLWVTHCSLVLCLFWYNKECFYKNLFLLPHVFKLTPEFRTNDCLLHTILMVGFRATCNWWCTDDVLMMQLMIF